MSQAISNSWPAEGVCTGLLVNLKCKCNHQTVCFSMNSFSLERHFARSWKLSCFCLMYANTLKLIPQFGSLQMKTIPVIPHSFLRHRQWELFFPPNPPFLFDIPSLTSTRFFETNISFPKKFQLAPSHYCFLQVKIWDSFACYYIINKRYSGTTGRKYEWIHKMTKDIPSYNKHKWMISGQTLEVTEQSQPK